MKLCRTNTTSCGMGFSASRLTGTNARKTGLPNHGRQTISLPSQAVFVSKLLSNKGENSFYHLNESLILEEWLKNNGHVMVAVFLVFKGSRFNWHVVITVFMVCFRGVYGFRGYNSIYRYFSLLSVRNTGKYIYRLVTA